MLELLQANCRSCHFWFLMCDIIFLDFVAFWDHNEFQQEITGRIKLFFRIYAFMQSLIFVFSSRAELLLRIVAMEQQLIVFKKRTSRPKLSRLDRIFFGCGSNAYTWVGKRFCIWWNRIQWSGGIARDSSATGVGFPKREQEKANRWSMWNH